ncbi:lytic murein transglycosylase [Oceanidesulfovibrio marinus]|uniref:Peptidoglycan-binding protein n=1 Tax=Oceanidesulfovibrio marinus TaxID=370038 RepID=A0A6P1ZLM1_9BACT|nr:lytic murein transglycosylase [Oceanidesulfovibrio marinus]TVM36672.1 peptidoglycan-binding protein [Oceanidesulfovibrio marinus]
MSIRCSNPFRIGPLLAAALLCNLVAILVAPCAEAQTPPAWRPLVDRLVLEGFDRAAMDSLFARAGLAYDPEPMVDKMEALYATKYGIRLVRAVQTELVRLGYLDDDVDGKVGPNTRNAVRLFEQAHGMAVTGVADEEILALAKRETQPKPADLSLPEEKALVYSSVLTPERLAEASAFYKAHRKALQKMRASYGVPEEIAVGIVTVETRCGLYLGEENAFATLASMAASRNPTILDSLVAREKPTPQQRSWLYNRMNEKADWAQNELVAMLQYAALNGLDPLRMPGSVYGAIGICQFMPTNAVKFGVDGDADGAVNLYTADDALMSLGNFLNEHGWKAGAKNRRAQRKALYRYNHSIIYVNTVLAVADHIRRGAPSQ